MCVLQYAAKEFQQALDILDAEEPASKKLLDRNRKEESGTPESTKEWDMSPASVRLITRFCGGRTAKLMLQEVVVEF